MLSNPEDYKDRGLDIQHAMLDRAKGSKLQIPPTIIWGDKVVRTADVLNVPPRGTVRGEFIRIDEKVRQGFDLEVNGNFFLPNGDQVPLLRTWYDPRLPRFIQYPYESRDCKLHVWNVYEMSYPGGQIVEEKWTGNAGCWIEEKGPLERIYHCSHGGAKSPDFDALVFKLTVEERKGSGGVTKSQSP